MTSDARLRSAPGRTVDRATVAAAALDAAVIVVFVAIGRDSHDEGVNLGGLVAVAAPFLIALAVGWCATHAWRAPRTVRTGVQLWLVTVALGMLLRHTVFDRGTAFAFIVVATVFLGLFLVGWRALAAVITKRRPRRPASQPA